MINLWFRIGSIMMLLGVGLGAFGTHGLKPILSPEQMQIYQTGVFYQFIHAIGLFVVAWAVSNKQLKATSAGYAFLFGILIFSGSLYALALTGIKGFGAVTPVGGLLFLFGWIRLSI